MYILYTERGKIHAHEELRERSFKSDITPDRCHDLIYTVTDDRTKADIARAKLILEQTKRV